MLEQISIRNYALIDTLSVEFGDGLNVLSGETGAGKSIIVGALGLLLGDKGETDAIRSGTEEAEVSGVLRVAGNREAQEWLAEREIEPEDGTVLLRRVVRSGGRGSSFIQSTQATRKDLQEFTAKLVDMHGQHEHQSLLTIENHRKLVDKYADAEELGRELYRSFYRMTDLKKELDGLKRDEREMLRERDLLEFAVKEIEGIAPKPGEEEELGRERDVLNQQERLYELFSTCYRNTAEAEGGALARLRETRKALEEMSRLIPELEDHRQRLENAFYEVEDIAETVREKQHSIDFSPGRLEEVEDRLQQISRLEKKYGPAVEDVLEYAENARGKLNEMEHQEEREQELREEIGKAEEEVVSLARRLSAIRREAAGQLERQIEEKLHRLGMPKASFSISATYREGREGKHSLGPYGYDRIEFLISPNEGEPLKPLREVASGGEISRIMLAIKTVFSETDNISALIFDEIDVGIGGEVAAAVGEHLAEIAGAKQVLCITHLASIAVRADTHFRVEKSERQGRTFTTIRTVDGEERTEEVARMLSGEEKDDTSRSHARELLRRYGYNRERVKRGEG
jgi:DNA repair protein RecN (Recombination protein N)